MIRILPRGARAQRGAAAVETAIVLPLLLFVVFGIIDFGRMLNTQMKLTEAAREGARASVMGQNPDSRVQTVMCAHPVGDPQCDSAHTGVKTTADTTYALGGGAAVCPGSAGCLCPANPTPSDDAVIYANYTFTFITPVGALASLLHVADPTNGSAGKVLNGKGVMPCVG